MYIPFELIDRGMVSSDQLVQALRHQVALRKPVGQLAVDNQMMRMGEVFDVLAQQRDLAQSSDTRLPFGRVAIQMGYLNRSQLGELMLQQLDQTPGVDEVLVDEGVLDAEVLVGPRRARPDSNDVSGQSA
ncbi:hypothetical protein [Crateriforma spongiae]|uniref:hypothetical protein n=1 Tax=Crateriforma spongiae TaxID=2724528 RepID=UPI0039AFD30B